MNRRHFSSRQKLALFIETKGLCSHCSQPLKKGWHADHIIPYSKNGTTDLINAQALCPKCNIKKGAKK